MCWIEARTFVPYYPVTRCELLPAVQYNLGRSSSFWLKGISIERLSFKSSEAKSTGSLGKKCLGPKVEIWELQNLLYRKHHLPWFVHCTHVVHAHIYYYTSERMIKLFILLTHNDMPSYISWSFLSRSLNLLAYLICEQDLKIQHSCSLFWELPPCSLLFPARMEPLIHFPSITVPVILMNLHVYLLAISN